MRHHHREHYISTGGEVLAVRAVDADDQSPIVRDTESLRCGLCWLNIAHTVDLHAAEVAR